MPASRRRSLIISEWAFNNAGFPGIGDYPFGGFLKPGGETNGAGLDVKIGPFATLRVTA